METVQRTTNVAILTKGMLTAAIVLDLGVNCPDGHLRHVVGSCDPRYKMPLHLRSYATASLALDAWLAALRSSTDNGWTVAHIGERNYG